MVYPVSSTNGQSEQSLTGKRKPVMLNNETMRYIRAILRGLWLIAIAAVLAGYLAYSFRSRQATTYTSNVRLFIGNAIELPDPDSRQLSTATQLAPIYAELAQSFTVLNDVIEELELNTDVERLGSRIRTRVIEATPILNLSVTWSTPELARDIANLTAQNLIRKSPSGLTDAETLQMSQLSNNIAQLENQITITNEQALTKLEELNEAQITSEDQETIDAISAEYYRIVDQLNTSRSTLAQMSETFINLSGRTNELEVIEEARPGIPNEGINPIIIAVAGLIVGAGFGVGILLLLEYMNNTIRDEYEVDEVLELPVVGQVRRVRGTGKKAADYWNKLVDPNSQLGENYRTMRNTLLPLFEAYPDATWMVVSPNQRDGRTFTTANLSIVASLANFRTLLIDADLRSSNMHTTFDVANNTGLAQMLENSPEELDSQTIRKRVAIRRKKILPNLHIIPSGVNESVQLSENMLTYTYIKEWIDLIRNVNSYDMVLMDTSAASDVSDSYALATRMKAKVLIVVNAGKTKKIAAQNMKARFERSGVEVVGVIINRV